MKKPYISPEAQLYSLKFEENIAVSGGSSSVGDDSVAGSMIILFSHAVSPCRGYYTGSTACPNTKGNNATFFEYFQDMQASGAPIGCLQLL